MRKNTLFRLITSLEETNNDILYQERLILISKQTP